jgi:ectoine hydroxylase-related dioxygenase (phytanoyl-CoA dioxygenase family)
MTVISPGQPLPDSQRQEIVEEFFREGCVVVPQALSPEQVTALRERTDYYFENRATTPPRHFAYDAKAFVLRHCADLGPLFQDLITQEPIYGLAETVLGPKPEFNAMNVIRNEPQQAISHWHVDDTLEFPLPPDIPRFDARMRMPVFWFTVQIALSDIDTLAHGPTQYVPGSHYSGRYPPQQDEPIFEGQGPKAVYCKAGDIYFTNHQTWHRGAPNTSDRTRYVLQVQYAARWASRRFAGLS